MTFLFFLSTFEEVLGWGGRVLNGRMIGAGCKTPVWDEIG